MNNHLDQAHKRSLQYWYLDGISELTFGGLCLLLGIYFIIQVMIPSGTALYWVLGAGTMIIILAGVFLMRYLVQRIKERLTYPRTGYIAYRQPKGVTRWIRVALGCGIGFLVAMLAAKGLYNPSFSWMPASTGIIFSFALFISSYRTGLLRLYVLTALALLAGGGLGFSRIENTLGVGCFYLIIGLAFAISGTITFWRYVRHNPPPHNPPQEPPE